MEVLSVKMSAVRRSGAAKRVLLGVGGRTVCWRSERMQMTWR